MDQFDDHRFETFKMGNSSHSGSHSRNSSISLSVSTSSKSTNSLEIIPSKRNSHHRRRSSVSTRHESAEIMGVSVAELTPSPSRDSFNLGEKDSIRQKALWALEGKPDASYIKVEIPELSTTEIDTELMFDFPTRPSFPPGSGAGFGSGMSSKRDSFKLLGGTLTSKDQLGTLVEEEEEDSDSESRPITPASVPSQSVSLESSDGQNIPQVSHRARPANLSLRPLSLTPESLSSLSTTITTGLPTPPSAPSSQRSGLKALSLLANSADDPTKSATTTHDNMSDPAPNPKRPTLNLQISSESLASSVTCVSSTTSSPDDGKVTKGLRRSSISYKCSQATTTMAGLPTPEMTPTFKERRNSGNSSISSRSSLNSNLDIASNGEEESASTSAFSRMSQSSKHRSLTASEQHFLFKSHNALLARITDLERALSVRRRESYGFASSPLDGNTSRPMSTISDVSSNSAPGEPNDEMLRLVADLKAERDELKRDVDGWRNRVSDLEKQIGIFTKRIDNERRDAWVARSRVGLLEVEKTTLLKDVEAKESVIAELTKLVEKLEEEKRTLSKEQEELAARHEQLKFDKADVEAEVERWRQQCELLKDESPLATPTPILSRTFEFSKRSLVFDAPRTVKDGKPSMAQDDALFTDEDNGLANYEDEEDGDMSFHGSSSSFGSIEEDPRSVAHLVDQKSPVVPSRPPSELQAGFQFPRATHQSRSSLSKTWTFPRGSEANTDDIHASESIDRFFECLHDSNRSESTGSPVSSDSYTYDRAKDVFANALKSVAEDDTPFFLPRGIGATVSPSNSSSTLDSVAEEDEGETEESDRLTVFDEDEDMFGDIGGIKITFTPPQEETRLNVDPEPLPSSVEQDDGNKMRSFTFGRPSAQSSTTITPPKAVPRSMVPSAIPRYSAIPSEPVVTPPKLNSPRFGTPTSSPPTFVTPPTKRGGIMPSFIPQPVTPPSLDRSSSNNSATRATFIRQPQRRPLMAANGVVPQVQSPSNAEHCMNIRFTPSRSINSNIPQTSGSAQIAPIDLNDNNSFPPPTPKYPIKPSTSPSSPSSTLTYFMTSPLQTFTNMIPLPWSPKSRPLNSQADAVSPDHDTFVNQVPSPPRLKTASEKGPLNRGYVSKEVQLEKLKLRLTQEQSALSKADQTCKKCVDELVFL